MPVIVGWVGGGGRREVAVIHGIIRSKFWVTACADVRGYTGLLLRAKLIVVREQPTSRGMSFR